MDLQKMLPLIGNILTIVFGAVAFVRAWQKLNDELKAMDARVQHVERQLSALSEKGLPTLCTLHAERLAGIEKKLEALPAIAADISWIKQSIQNGNSERSNQ